LLDNVLCPMPQYAESVQQNNPLIQRLKFHTKSRAHTRQELEEAAKSEGGVYKQGSQSRVNRDGSGNRAMSPGRGGVDSSPRMGNRRDEESESGSGSDSDSGDDRANGGASGASGQGPRDLWQQLCITQQGRFFNSATLTIELKQEYNTSMGRLTFTYQNVGREPIGNIRVNIPEVPYLRTQQFNEAPTSLGPGQQAQHFLQVQCLRPFLQPCKYLVEYSESRGGPPVQLPFMLPAVITKFVAPTEIQVQPFQQFFESLGGQPREVVSVGQAKEPPSQWQNYFSKGFNMFVLRESDEKCVLAAGTLHTATPDPSKQGQMMTVPCLVRIEFDPGRRMARLTVRSQHGEVSQALAKIIETYLMVPGSQNGNA